jgi:S-adenosylmethionine synthetase
MVTTVSALEGPAIGGIEIVEHKGIGHPDTICDALAENLSVAFSRFCLEHFGSILHHNVDKALLWGGTSRARFGGGEVVAPMEIFLAGRATLAARGVTIPIREMAIDGSRAWLRRHLHALDPSDHVKFHCLVRPGSADLVNLFQRNGASGASLANDTSIGAGYAPLSELERVVLAVAARLRSLATTTPEVGEDTKVLGIRRGDRICLTVACAFVDRFLATMHDYVERRAALADDLATVARGLCSREVRVEVNAADDVSGELASKVFLTVTGTSAEAGDDGEVGRGNRVNGLITPYRPMTLEAAAGKNPMTHVGKLYNVAAHQIAASVVAGVPGVTDCECYLVSRIGQPARAPEVVDVRLRLARGTSLEDVARPAQAIVEDGIRGVDSLWKQLVRGETPLF